MININDYENDLEFQNSEISDNHCKFFERQRPPFFPIPVDGTPVEKFTPPDFNFPEENSYSYGMPKSPPPNYVPSKNDGGVQSFSQSQYGPGAKAVSPNSIRFCLYKYTYIWEVNGRSYWAFLLNVDRRSVSGFRWLGRRWVYFGLNLRRIDSFVCYNRSTIADECENCRKFRQDDISLQSNKKEYSLTETRDVYTQTLLSIDIPEVKEDFICETIDSVDDNTIESEIPCLKSRNIGYRITLEVSYPNAYDIFLKNKINEAAYDASNEAYKILTSTRGNDGYSNPLETFNSSLSLIPDALRTFSDSFNSKLKSLTSYTRNDKDIIFTIRQEKNHGNWKQYNYNNSLF